jgi:hypothetical protein
MCNSSIVCVLGWSVHRLTSSERGGETEYQLRLAVVSSISVRLLCRRNSTIFASCDSTSIIKLATCEARWLVMAVGRAGVQTAEQATPEEILNQASDTREEPFFAGTLVG